MKVRLSRAAILYLFLIFKARSSDTGEQAIAHRVTGRWLCSRLGLDG
ncbi:hypothetical protein NG799_11900 [Laspinema sp. D1]|uniref:Uncharacterized protein n=1 Tax=Laspinema palackyanum D2a TaxID=2953684 RepID=A0ABT2MQQ4_9CYAN|nr:hypothetical protein [Laspinema sp. D2b]MCT7967040.1 hypothetical protein [Laspinema sp. D2a]